MKLAGDKWTATRQVSSCLLLLVALTSLFGLVHSARAAAPEATVDRNEMSLDETLQLTVSVNESSVFGSPDLSPLETNFEVYHQAKSSQRSIINGRVSAVTEWRITLLPKREGKLVIPPLELDGQKTRPITITVRPAGTAAQSRQSGDLFLEAEIDHKAVYRGAQILHKLRIFDAGVLASGSSLAELKVEDAIVRKIAETEYQRVVNGRRYRVLEYTHAIFPTTSGVLEIPSQVLTAQIATGGGISFFGRIGETRTIIKRSTPFEVTVKPLPASAGDKDAITASEVTLEETWSGDITRLTVGDSVTRQVTLKAIGAPSQQLPPIFWPETDGVKMYSDQPQLQDIDTPDGLTGIRVESIALVPTRPGTFRLPEARVYWFDVDTGSLRAAVLKPVELRVVAASNAPSTGTAAPTGDTGATDIAAGQAHWPPASPGWLAGASVAWFLSLLLCWQLAARHYRHERPRSAPGTTSRPDATAALQNLVQACQANDSDAAYPAVLAWARARYQDPAINCIEHIHRHAGSAELVRALRQLERSRFGSTPQAWTGEALLAAVRAADSRPREAPPQALRPLYGS